MTYEEAVQYLDGLKGGPVRLGLERVRRFLSVLGDPQEGLFAVHVAGTNGKGSVAAMLCSIIGSAGKKVGLFTSPHLHDPRERIRIGEGPIERDELSRLVGLLAPAARDASGGDEGHPTYFEFITALAVRYFIEQGVEAAIFEVGLGGRLDATNALPSQVQVITNVGVDHVSYLGSSPGGIAREKADIIKDGGSVVTAEGPGEALGVIEEVCASRGGRLYRVGKEILYGITEFGLGGQELEIVTPENRHARLRIALLGPHQARNAATAVAAAECLRRRGMSIGERAVREGLAKARWPGRFEVFPGRPLVVLDGAHNPAGAEALARTLRDYLPGKEIDLVLGIMKDKDYVSVSSHLAPLAARILTCPVGSDRSLDPVELGRACSEASRETPVFAMESVDDAIGFSLSGDAGAVCVAGSLYLVAHARELLLGRYPSAGD